MKSMGFNIFIGRYIAVILYLSYVYTYVNASKGNDETARSLYMSSGLPLAKGGWRPILTPDNLASYNFANVLGGHAIGQKILTGPAVVETKIISPHIVGVSPFTTEIFGNGIISTSTRPIVTRDASKLTTMPQSYKATNFPQSSINLNSPVKTYYNPFSIPTGPGVSAYKVTPGFQYDNNPYMKHQQINHRPVYNKIPGHNMMGKRLKQSQAQSHMYQQFSAPNHHQQMHSYQNGMKKPMDSYQRPKEIFPRPGENVSKYNTVIHHHQNYVNPQDSLLTQTKSKPQSSQNVAVVTYKPPFSTHFQQFGIKEEPFGPIPSSILGSFSSFGHASVKARDPNSNSNNKINYISSTTIKPFVSTEAFPQISSTAAIKVKIPSQEKKILSSIKQQPTLEAIKDDFAINLVPPPKASQYTQTLHKVESKLPIKGTFIPSPPDPLNKHNNAPEILKPLGTKTKQNEPQTYNTNLSTRRPEMSSFFETASSLSTVDPFDSQSTNAIPDNLLVQLPPPYTTATPYIGSQQSGKLENAPKKENYPVYHGKIPAKFNTFDSNKFFPPSTGHDFFGSKFPTKNNNDAIKFGYEVTENWASSGETNTQPTLHTWVNKPINPYKLHNPDLQPPPIPVSYPPTYPSNEDYSTIFSTAVENDKNKGFFSQLENSLSSLDLEKKPIGDEVYDLAAPLNISYVSDEKPKITVPSTTPTYDDITTQRSSGTRRKPIRYKPHYETSTLSNVDEDFTTRFETFKEQIKGTENDLQVNELPTIPPHKHFKRPLIITTTSKPVGDTWDDLNSRRNNKPRRRRPIPIRASSTTEATNEDPITELPPKIHRFRTTTIPTNVEDVTKPIRPKIRIPPYRSRLTTKPTSQPELTSSAQPTSLPTSPVTLRTRLHSRIRVTTLPSLDFEDLLETTTLRGYKQVENNDKQSSIMKIAKDKHSSRTSLNKLHATLKETPDYSHKQDEKDTPTSDIAINTFNHKYSAQKLQNGNDEFSEITSQLTADGQHDSDVELSTEEPSSIEIENYPKHNIETSQTIRNEQFTELKSGNRGNIKSVKTEETTSPPSASGEDITTTTTTPDSQNKRLKLKPGKFENTRPRFSVKDYRNRLNQYTSTSTDKPTYSSETSVSRIRFPTRSRFPSFKEQHEPKEANNATEVIRKKFVPKDPRHRTENQEAETPQENEVISKPITKPKSGPRRDPNRVRIPVISEIGNVTDVPQKSINTYANLKRPTNRKKIQKTNSTEITDFSSLDVTTTTTTTPTVDTSNENNDKIEVGTERYTSETAIMKIAKEDRKNSNNDDSSENASIDHSQRVSDLTLASSKDYNTPGLFKSISPNSRKVPNYFTIATDDPILPIEAFFPQLNQKKET